MENRQTLGSGVKSGSWSWKSWWGGRTVPSKRLFEENGPLHFLILMGSFARTLFSWTLLPWPILCYSGRILQWIYMQRFSNTSFGRTLLGSNFGGLLLKQTFCWHFAAFESHMACHTMNYDISRHVWPSPSGCPQLASADLWHCWPLCIRWDGFWHEVCRETWTVAKSS